MTIEERLRRALDAEAGRVDVDRHAWGRVQRKVAARRRARATAAGVLAAAAVVAVVVGLASSLSGGGNRDVEVGPAGDGRPAPTTEVPAMPAVEDDGFVGIWPFTSRRQADAYRADPGEATYLDGEATALAFAREYLGMPAPVTTSGFVASADGFSGAVAVKAKPRYPMVTRISLRRVGGREGPFAVVGADTDNIRVDRPDAGDVVAANLAVAGTSTAFEATVSVEVRQDGQRFGDALARTFVMGGANGTMGPFAGDVTIDPPTAPAGAVLFFTESAEDGSVQEATVVPVRFGPAQPSGGLLRFSVFFHRGEELVEVGRETARTPAVLRAALESLFRGPDPELDGQGLSSFFSAATADLLAGVALRPDGTAVVDLARMVPNASTSAGSRLLLEELDATVFQFSTVERIEYRLQGSCDAFWAWLQFGPCRVVEPPR